MLYIKEWKSKQGNQVKAIFCKIDNKEYFICFVK